MASAEPDRFATEQPSVASQAAIRPAEVVHGLPLPGFVLDGTDRIAAWNVAAAVLFDTDAPAVLGRSLRDVTLVDRMPRLEAAAGHVRRAGGSLMEEATVTRGGRAAIPVRLTMARMMSVGGPPLVLVVAEQRSPPDVIATLERVERERDVLRSQLEGTRRALEAASDASARDAAERNKFLAMLAHELRNPLAAMTNALYVVRKRIVDARVGDALGVLERQIGHLTRMLDGLLDVSRVTLGKIELDRAVVDLRAVVGDVVQPRRAEAERRALLLSVSVAPEPALVTGDRTRLQQVVDNLLANALKYTPTGGEIVVDVRRDGADAVIRVTDTGVGIPPALLPKVFDLFTQGDRSLARSEGGLGIGLTLVRLLVEMHGGRVEAQSAGVNRGTELVVRLPCARSSMSATPAPASPVSRERGRVLVVDDNVDARAMLRAALELEGYAVDTAGEARTAIKLASGNAPNVAVIDIGLPGMDGYELARRLRTRLGTSVRLVALSGYGDDRARASADEAGYDVYLVKPVPIDDLVRRLGTLNAEPS